MSPGRYVIHVSLLSVGVGTRVCTSVWGLGWYPPTAGGGRGCGAVVRWRAGVASREGGLGLSLDDMVCGCHILGDILEQRESWMRVSDG